MKTCERCGRRPKAVKSLDAQMFLPELFDYCAVCSRDLCPDCMAGGCCDVTPARSGMVEDLEDDGHADALDERRSHAVCELCFRSVEGQPPKYWALLLQSWVCSECLSRSAQEGLGISLVPGGRYAEGREDPREGKAKS